MADFRVEHADWTLDAKALHQLREAVFVIEQQVPAEEEWDDLDAVSEHVLALSAEGEPVGCGRLTPERKIGRMAVLPDWRGHGVGAAMLRMLIERAREHGWDTVTLHAQATAVDFYRQHGFAGYGERFMEAGIEHLAMRRTLEPIEPAPAQRGKLPPRPQAEILACSTSAELRQAVLQLLGQARHRITVHSRLLEPGLPDDDDIIAELRRLATSGRGAKLRFLISDADQILRDGHRLVPLAQRLDSSIRVRVLTESEDHAYPSSFILNDVGGYVLQARASLPKAIGSSCAPGEHARLQNYFDEVWERSTPATVWRKLEL